MEILSLMMTIVGIATIPVVIMLTDFWSPSLSMLIFGICPSKPVNPTPGTGKLFRIQTLHDRYILILTNTMGQQINGIYVQRNPNG